MSHCGAAAVRVARPIRRPTVLTDVAVTEYFSVPERWFSGRFVRAPGYRSLAVDPAVIPLGSRVYIPAYRAINGGWFRADDVGGAIQGRHVDVFRAAPRQPGNRGRVLRGQRITVIPPGR